MKKISLEIINKIHDYGYEAYVIGGFVRDMLLDIPSEDVDITTNATPMELKNIFPDALMENESYGAVALYYKNYRFDITTYRKDLEYLDNRHPSSILYINDLHEDLLRRDFTINTICMDINGEVVDLLKGQVDLHNHVIKTVIDSDISFNRDALRILRAIRFAALLDFRLSDEIINSIKKNKHLLKKISYQRKKMELDKIFGSNKAKEGIALIKKLDLSDELDLPNLDRIKDFSDIVGIWSMINTDKYQFSASEKDLIKKINIVYNLDNLNNEVLYKYGLYVNIIAGINKGINKIDIIHKYESLPIKRREDINLLAKEICELLNKKPGSFIGKIYNDLESLILNEKIKNDSLELREYVKRWNNE